MVLFTFLVEVIDAQVVTFRFSVIQKASESLEEKL